MATDTTKTSWDWQRWLMAVGSFFSAFTAFATTPGSWGKPLEQLWAVIRKAFPALEAGVARFFLILTVADLIAGVWKWADGTKTNVLIRLRNAGFGSFSDPIGVFAWVAGYIVSITTKVKMDVDDQTYTYQLETNKVYRPTQLDVNEVLKLYVRGDIPPEQAETYLAEAGYSDTFIAYLKKNAHEFLSVGDVIEVANRQFWSDTKFKEWVQLAGVRDDHLNYYVELRYKTLDIASLVDAAVRTHITETEYLALGNMLGYQDSNLKILLKSAGQPLAIGEMLNLWNRGEVKESDVDQALRESNINEKYYGWAKKLRYNLLTASDYIRFAVREVFDPTQREALQLDEDYPKILTDKLQKIGYSETDAKDAWAAHWELPSPSQVFTMLHYGLFDEVGKDEYVKKYLKAADYSPEWRDYMLKISYNPLTRVDARRAFKIGEIDDIKLKEIFMKEGYTSDDADILVKFTKADVLGEKRADAELLYGPLKSTLLSMYKSRRISREILETHLTNMGFAGLQIEQFVQEVEFARQVDHAEEIAAALKSAYVKTLRSRKDTKDLLIQAGYDDAGAEQVLEPWDFLRATTELSQDQVKTRDLTKSEIMTAYTDGVLDTPQVKPLLTALGYDDNEITTLIAIADYGRTKQLKADQIELLHQQYLSSHFTLEKVTQELDNINVPYYQKNLLLIRWEREKRGKSPGFSYAQLKEFAVQGVIDESKLYNGLRTLGYERDDILMIEKAFQLEYAKAHPAPKAPVQSKLTRKDAEAMYLAEPPQRVQSRELLKKLGYTTDDIQYIVDGLEKELDLRKKASS